MTLEISATNVEIDPNGGREVTCTVEVADRDIDTVINQIDLSDIVSTIGADKILEHIGLTEIGDYLEAEGYQIVEEE